MFDKISSIFKIKAKNAKRGNLLSAGWNHDDFVTAMGEELTDRFETMFRTYLEAVDNAERNRKLGEGMFGFPGGPANHPCHEQFVKQLEEFLEEFRQKVSEYRKSPEEFCQKASDPRNTPDGSGMSEDGLFDSKAVKTVLTAVYASADLHHDMQSAYWTLIAVHGLTGNLIGLLSPEDAAELLAAYEDSFPRSRRLPAQNKVVSLLKETAG